MKYIIWMIWTKVRSSIIERLEVVQHTILASWMVSREKIVVKWIYKTSLHFKKTIILIAAIIYMNHIIIFLK